MICLLSPLRWLMRHCLFFLPMIFGILVLSSNAMAQNLSLDLGQGSSSTMTATLVQLTAIITLLSLAPSLLVVITSFGRIVVVLSLLRTAIGAQQTPPNTILIGLALFLTAFIMTPTFEQAWQD